MRLRRAVIRYREKGVSAEDWSHKIADLLESEGVSVQLESSSTREGKSSACSADLIIVVGGDGTLLGLVSMCGVSMPPVLGFAAESLGYLLPHDARFSEAVLKEVIAGNYKIREVRLGEYVHGESKGVFLNEVGLWAPRGKLIECTVRVGGIDFYRARSDGILVSTPAGSTAHALSYGGAIVFNLDEKILEVVYPGALSLLIRPLVIYNQSVGVALSKHSEEASLVVDGRYKTSLAPGSEVAVAPSSKTLELLIVEGYAVNPVKKLYSRLVDMGRWPGE